MSFTDQLSGIQKQLANLLYFMLSTYLSYKGKQLYPLKSFQSCNVYFAQNIALYLQKSCKYEL